MDLKLLFLVATLLYFASAQRRQKIGDCPPYPRVGICDLTCYEDAHCRGIQKCCRTACGGSFCTMPVQLKERELAPPVSDEKEGECPDPPTGPWVCSSRCSVDSNCRGKKKCCKNRCGAMACVNPASSDSLE